MASNTPDSDIGSIECFQNYTAPEVFVQGLAGTVDQQDVECIIRAQKQMLQRFEKTNEMLANCNTLCVTRLKTASVEFKKHIQVLTEIRKDLDNIFKRISVIKGKVLTQYPEAKELEKEKEVLEAEVENKDKPEAESTSSHIETEANPLRPLKNSSSSESNNSSSITSESA